MQQKLQTQMRESTRAIDTALSSIVDQARDILGTVKTGGEDAHFMLHDLRNGLEELERQQDERRKQLDVDGPGGA